MEGARWGPEWSQDERNWGGGRIFVCPSSSLGTAAANEPKGHLECADLRVRTGTAGPQGPHELCERAGAHAANVGTHQLGVEVEQPLQLQRLRPCDESDCRICLRRSKWCVPVVRTDCAGGRKGKRRSQTHSRATHSTRWHTQSQHCILLRASCRSQIAADGGSDHGSMLLVSGFATATVGGMRQGRD